MKFTTNQQDLAPILVHLSRATNNLTPAVEITANKDTLTLKTSDCSIWMAATIPAIVEETGTATMNCKELSALVNRLAGKVNYDNGMIKSNGSKFKFDPIELEIAQEPIVVEEPTAIETKELLQQLKRTVFCTANDGHSVLSGVLLDGDKVVATDGNMLAVNKLSTKLLDKQTILPNRLVDEIVKCFSNVENINVSTNSRCIVVSSDKLTISSTLIEGMYPKYAQLIPQNYTKKTVIDKSELLYHVGNIELATNQRTNICKLAITQTKLTLSANKDGCEGEEYMDIESTDSLDIAFNIGYLLKILKNYDSDVIEFSFDGALSAGLFKPNDSDLALLMPVATRT